MKTTDIIKKAILSEKAYKQMEKGVYTFLVNQHATKDEIKKAIQNQFSVDATKVNVASFSAKTRRIAHGSRDKVGGGKKAIVHLTPGQTIAILSPKGKEKPKQKKEKEVEKVSVEGKEAA